MNLFATVLLTSLAIVAVQGYGCGGLLEGDAGQLEFPIEGNADGESNCLWIIKLISGSGLRFTLNRIGAAGVLSLYPEHEATETILNPIRLDTTAINSTVLTSGQVLVVVLAKSSSSTGIEFTWESDGTSNSPIARAASYVDTPEGRVQWTKFGQQERLTWGLGVDPSKTLTIRTVTDFSRCEDVDPCQCSYFAVYEVTPEGYLREATRVCGRASESTIEQLYSQLVAFVYVNSTSSSTSGLAEITWIASESDVLTTTTTSPTTTTTTTSTITTTPTSPTTTTELTDSTLPPESSLKLKCGGIINIPDNEVSYVEYKLVEFYDNNELCIWIVNASFQTINISTVSQGLEPNYDGIHIYNVPHYMPKNIEQCALNSCNLVRGKVFILFSSDATVLGTGFKLRLAPTGTDSHIKSSFHLVDPSGSLKYPPSGSYSNNERFLAVLQLNTSSSLQLSTVNTEASLDFVRFFTVFPFAMHKEPTFDGEYSGTNTDGSLSYSLYPRIVTFTTDGSVTSTGFTFEWASETQTEPTTLEPTTRGPTTLEPTTRGPTTLEPTTLDPTTRGPTTLDPTTRGPTTLDPTTLGPTTLDPTTRGPTTLEPTTLDPTTRGPTTLEPSTLEPSTPSTDVELVCGGIIDVTTSSEVTVRYKLNERYNIGEFCVWGIQPNFGLGWSEVTVELLEDGFNAGQDGLEAYFDQEATTETTNLSRCTFTNTTRSCTLRNGMGFLAFSSNIVSGGTGFRAKISMGDANDLESSAAFYNTNQGNLSYPASAVGYSYSERHLDILQVNVAHTVHINSVSTELYYDTVSLYRLDRYGSSTNFRLDGRWSGDFPDGQAADLTLSSYPRVVIFKSDSSNSVYRGYNLTWKAPASSYAGQLATDTYDRLTKGGSLLLSKLLKPRA